MRRGLIAFLAIAIVVTIAVGYFVVQPKAGPKITDRIMIDGVVLNVDLAATPAQQQQGLSGRTTMAEDHGMLFIFQSEDYWSFWMYEMKFPLDMIWFNSNRQAVFFEQNLQPCSSTVCQVFKPSAEALYVLEVNAGFIKAHNVSLGDTFTFVGVT